MKQSNRLTLLLLSFCSLLASTLEGRLAADGSATPLPLLDPAAATSTQQISANDGQTSFSVNGEGSARGIDITVQPGTADYPGITIKPPTGAVWDLSAYGHVEAQVSNTGDNPVKVSIRVDNEGDWQQNPWSASATDPLSAGESHFLSVVFGYAYNQPAYALNPAAVNQILIYVAKTDVALKFRVGQLQAAGSPGEKVTIQPIPFKIKPGSGVVFGTEVTPHGSWQSCAGESRRPSS